MSGELRNYLRDALTIAEIMGFTLLAILGVFAAVVARFFFQVEARVRKLEEK